jgi:hypothetical protein
MIALMPIANPVASALDQTLGSSVNADPASVRSLSIYYIIVINLKNELLLDYQNHFQQLSYSYTLETTAFHFLPFT